MHTSANTTQPPPVTAALHGLCAVLAWLRRQGDRHRPRFLVMRDRTGQHGILRAIRAVPATLRQAPTAEMAVGHRHSSPLRGMPALVTTARTAGRVF